MPTLLIGLSDPHFSDKKPRSRKDDFQETQRRKLRDVLKLASSIKWGTQNTKASALLMAGDVFHQPKGKLISRKLDHGLMQLMREATCPILAIAGNHDLDRDRLESLEEHPLGTLVASGLISLTHWPDYLVVGEEVPVIITGRHYTIDGPGAWLEHLTTTGKLKDLKKRVSDETGKKAQAVVMTHNYWGPSDGNFHGDPVVGHHRAKDIGAEIILYGHPHTYDGAVEVEGTDGITTIVGPGALIRGTLAETDVKRKPMIMVSAHESDGSYQVVLAQIPHEKAEDVFDLEKHERVKKEKAVQERFIQELTKLQTHVKSPEEYFSAATAKFPTRVVSRAKSYYLSAEGELAQA